MAEPVVSIAVIVPYEGQEQQVLELLRQLYNLMEHKQYSRNELYRDVNNPQHLVNLRYWTSAQARHEAQEDPDVHRCWSQMGQVCEVRIVREMLECVEWQSVSAGEQRD